MLADGVLRADDERDHTLTDHGRTRLTGAIAAAITSAMGRVRSAGLRSAAADGDGEQREQHAGDGGGGDVLSGHWREEVDQ